MHAPHLSRLLVLAAIDHDRLTDVVGRIERDTRRGRPWSCGLVRRVLIACVALRTNLTMRELAAVVGISKSSAHRIVARYTRVLASLRVAASFDRRTSWVVDGTLIPTRDHGFAAKSKNYRWSCNAQILIRRREYRGSTIEEHGRRHQRVLADGGYRGIAELTTPVFRGNRIVRDRRWRRHRRRRARVEHAIARLKDWRVLRDHRRKGRHLAETVRAVAFLHNLRVAALRDNS